MNSILDDARSLIYGDREAQYGHPRKNLTAISEFWTIYLRNKYGFQSVLEAEDVAQLMSLLKMCRDFNEKKLDSIVDQAAYVGLVGRLRYEQEDQVG